jgi:hypothetical protein
MSLEALTVTSPDDDITDTRTHEMDMHIDVEDELGVELALNIETTTDQRVFNSKVFINGIEQSKARAFKDFSKYREHASLTDRLKQVQALPRFVNTEKYLIPGQITHANLTSTIQKKLSYQPNLYTYLRRGQVLALPWRSKWAPS